MEKLIKRVLGLDNRFIFFFCISIATSFLSYFYQIFLGNKMEIADYGIFNSVNSLCSNILCFYSPLAIFLCRKMAEVSGKMNLIPRVIRKVTLFSAYVSIVITITLVVLFSFGYGEKISIIGIRSGVFVIATILSGGVYSVFNGALQGASRLDVYGIAGFLIVAIKMGITVILFMVISNVYAPLVAMLISNVIILVFIYAYLNRIKSDDKYLEDKDLIANKDLLALYGTTFVANALISPYINGGEVILMSSVYDNELVGMYSLGITLVKASIFIISIMTSALLPKFASFSLKDRHLYRLFFASVVISFVIGILWIGGIRVVGIKVIPPIFGEKYYDALLNTKYMALWVINLGVLMVVNVFYLAINRLKRYMVMLSLGTGTVLLAVKVFSINFWFLPVIMGIVTGAVILVSILDVCTMMKKALTIRGEDDKV